MSLIDSTATTLAVLALLKGGRLKGGSKGLPDFCMCIQVVKGKE